MGYDMDMEEYKDELENLELKKVFPIKFYDSKGELFFTIEEPKN